MFRKLLQKWIGSSVMPSGKETAETSRVLPRLKKSRLLLLVCVLVCTGTLAVLLFEVGLWRAQVSLDARQHQPALRWLSAVRWLRPSHAELHYLLARTHRRLGNFKEVEHHLRVAFEQGWDVRQLEREQWITLAQNGEFAKVNPHWGELFDSAGSDLPEIAGAYVRGALGLLRINDALRVIEIWKAGFPDDPEPFVIQGQIAESGLEWKSASEAYQEALQRASGRSDLHRELGRVLLELGQLDKSQQHLRVAVESEPDDVVALVSLGKCLSKAGRTDEARVCLKRAIAVDPGNASARKVLATLELTMGNAEAALDWILPVTEVHAEDAAARYTLAKALRTAGRVEDAEPHERFVAESAQPLLDLGIQMERLVADPLNIDLRFQIASTTLRYKSKEEGAAWLRSLLKVAPAHAQSHALLADYYSSLGNENKAAEHRRRGQEGP